MKKKTGQPVFIANLSMPKLVQTEGFAHDIIFGGNAAQPSPQLINFLRRGEVPVFGSQAKKTEANIQDYILLSTAAINYGRLDTSNLNWCEGD